MNTCELPKCQEPEYINYLGHRICEKHWNKYDREKLKEKLGINNETRHTNN